MEDGGSCCVVESGEGGVVVVVDDWRCEEVEVGGGVAEDSRLLRKSRSSASAFSSRVNCRLGVGSGCDDIDGCCRLSSFCVGRLSDCAFLLLLEDDGHHQPIVNNVFIAVRRFSRLDRFDIVCLSVELNDWITKVSIVVGD